MTVINVLKQTINLLQKDDLLETTDFGGLVLADENQQKEIDLLVFCANNVLTQIACEYLPIYEEKEIVSLDGTFLTSSLSENFLEIKKIESDGVNYGFKVVGKNVKTGKGLLNVTYSILPEKLVISDSIHEFDDRLTERILAFGIATEFLFIMSEYAQAAVWENRFKSSLETACRKKSEILMPKRRWL